MAALKATRRIWIPLALAALCLLATRWTPAVATMVLMITALGLVIDAGTKWWERTGGGMSQHRQ